MLRDALAALRKSFPDTHPRVAEARSRLGSCLVALGRRQEAEPLLRESLTVLRVSGAPAQERRVEKLLAGIPR
jgi:hypothetical protein